jgi:predicted ATPase/DNA-binding CsgD family transcriptional regulator/Tfp pilus assembly protein PilF
MSRVLLKEPLQPLALTNSLIGREAELTTVSSLLHREDVRLVTLTGPGGIGKTRLALRLVETVQSPFPDGTAVVDLACVRDGSLVLPAVGQALGLRDVGDVPFFDRVVRTVGDQRRLLLLDSFEHLVAEGAAVSDLLAACPRLAVLVTSREALRLSGEYEFPVPPLGLPTTRRHPSLSEVASSPAVELFLRRARSVRPNFDLTEENAPVIIEICARLDGLPLAIELAAARCKVLSPQALLNRLSHRLDLLTGGPRDAPTRLQTMRDAIAWSYDLLLPEEQALFRRLAIFAGGFTLDASETVDGQTERDESFDCPSVRLSVLDGVASLVDKSLLRQREGEDGEPRYWMLETVREYALGELARAGEDGAVRNALCRWSLGFAEDVARHIHGRGAAAWLNRVAAEEDNVRDVLTWLTATGQDADALRLVGAFWPYWFDRGSLSEGRRWMERVLSRTGSADGALVMPAMIGAGMLAMAQGDFDRAAATLEQGLAMATALGESSWIARAQFGLGVIAQDLGDPGEARQRFEAALASAETVHDDLLIATTLNNLGLVVARLGNLDQGQAYLEDGRRRHRAAGYHLGEALSLRFLGQVAQAKGDLPRAASLFRESLRFDPEELQSWHIAGALECLAATIGPKQQPDLAARLIGAAEALREEVGIPIEPALRDAHSRTIAAMNAALGKAAFERARAAGRAMSRREAVALAVQGPTAAPPRTDTIAPVAAPAPRPAGEPLTARETEVLRMLAEGLSTRDIADRLFISHRTVSTHTTNLLGKLRVDTRAAAIAIAYRNGLI